MTVKIAGLMTSQIDRAASQQEVWLVLLSCDGQFCSNSSGLVSVITTNDDG